MRDKRLDQAPRQSDGAGDELLVCDPEGILGRVVLLVREVRQRDGRDSLLREPV
jgi:hypothetical protein